MRYFQEIELANFMPISEAAEWIAFGHLPMAMFDTDANDRPIETRENIDRIVDHMSHHVERSEYMSNRVLSELFPEIEIERYLDCLDRCGGHSPEEILKQIESWRERFASTSTKERSQEERHDHEEFLKPIIENLEKDLVAAQEFRSIYLPVARKLGMAQAKLFLKLIGGEVPSRGVPMPIDQTVVDGWETEDWPTSFEAIPAENWSADGIDWKGSNLETWRGRYIGVIVATADILTHFPAPDGPAEDVSGELYSETFILKSDRPEYATLEKVSPRRGAPRRTEKVLDDAIYAHLDALSLSRSLPSKVEAQVAEISDFVQSRLGQSISRSTAQRLRAGWKDRHAQKDAQK